MARMKIDRAPTKKVCAFCKDKTAEIDYKDTGLLRRFLSDRGRIWARRISGTCRQHQRDIAVAVKNAREVALLPYVSNGGAGAGAGGAGGGRRRA